MLRKKIDFPYSYDRDKIKLQKSWSKKYNYE